MFSLFMDLQKIRTDLVEVASTSKDILCFAGTSLEWVLYEGAVRRQRPGAGKLFTCAGV